VGELASASFDQIVRETMPALYRLAARVTGSFQEAEDVVQDGYLRAWAALGRGQFEGRAEIETWLYRIVTNCAIDALRARQRRGRFAATLPEQVAAAGQSAEVGAALRELASWLEALPPDQRAAVVLKDMEGLTSAEIATILGCSEGAVEQKLGRGRATLRQRCRGG
jgi:RNA polymerase sigma-70 factor (ECF subfamily)